MMRPIFFLFFPIFFLLLQPLSGYELDLRQCRLDSSGRTLFQTIGGKEKQVGRIRLEKPVPGTENLVTVRLESGKLILDTREFYRKNRPSSPTKVTVYIDDIPLSEILFQKPGEASATKNRFELTLSSSPGGEPVNLLMLSAKGTRWGAGEGLLCSATPEKVFLDRGIPEGVRRLNLRFDFRTGGVYTVRGIRFFQQKADNRNIVRKKNLLRNGGAENGFYGTFMPYEAFRREADGTFSSSGRVHRSAYRYFIDRTEKHSGRQSFRIEGFPGFGMFNFNPVPYAAGESSTYSVWLKSDREMPVALSLYICNGSALSRNVTVTPEWKQYTLHLPRWGEKKGDGIQFYGGFETYGTATGIILPRIHAWTPGKLWIDDASYSIGGTPIQEAEQPVRLRSTYSKELWKGYQFPGEPVRFLLEAENYTAARRTGRLSWQLTDWMNRETASGTLARDWTIEGGAIRRHPVELTLPSHIRGPMFLTFRWSGAEGERAENTQYFGVIDSPRAPSERLGLELPGRVHPEPSIPYFKDFRIGLVRVGSASGFRHPEYTGLLHRSGLRVLWCVGWTYAARDNKPGAREEYRNNLDAMTRSQAGNVEFYEIQNEPNIAGFTTDMQMEILRESAAIIRRNDPSAKLAGPTTCTIDATWIGDILHKGGSQLLDLITYHPYSVKPEISNLDRQTESLHALIRRYREIPHAGTEAGHVFSPGIPDDRLDSWTRQATALDLRNILLTLSGGASRYYHFAFNPCAEGSDWNCLWQGNPENGNRPKPAPVFYALRGLADRLEKAESAGRISLGQDFRACLFDHGTKRTLVLWKWKGDPAAIRLPDGMFNAMYDIMGTRLPVPKRLVLNEFPVYLDTAAAAADVKQAIADAPLETRENELFDATVSVSGEREILVRIRNLTRLPRSGELTVESPGTLAAPVRRTFDAIGRDESTALRIPLLHPIGITSRPLTLRITDSKTGRSREFHRNLAGLPIWKSPHRLTMDGDLSDWKNVPGNPIELDHRNTDSRQHRGWDKKAETIRVRLRYAWDSDNLYLAAEVFKPDYRLSSRTKTPADLWQSDSLQLGLDPLNNATGGMSALADDDFEYLFGEWKNHPIIYRRWASSSLYDSLHKNQGIVPAEEAEFAIKRHADRVVYEIALKRRAVSPLKLVSGSEFRLSSLVNLNLNGKERTGYLELSPGIGHEKNPYLWLPAVLLDPADSGSAAGNSNPGKERK